MSKTTALHICITLFSTFLWHPHTTIDDVQPPNATFYGGHRHTMNTFPVCIWTWIKPIENSTPGRAAYNWRIEWFQIDAIKFERTQIHFFVIFSLLSLSFLLKVRSVYAEWQLLESVYTVCIKMFAFNIIYAAFLQCCDMSLDTCLTLNRFMAHVLQ